jgi:hypothetical protein
VTTGTGGVTTGTGGVTAGAGGATTGGAGAAGAAAQAATLANTGAAQKAASSDGGLGIKRVPPGGSSAGGTLPDRAARHVP